MISKTLMAASTKPIILSILSAGDIAFKPFYETYGRHSVYLNVTLKQGGQFPID